MRKLILLGLLFTGCTDNRDYNPKYVVSIGTVVFSVGYGTNKIDTVGDNIEFYNSMDPDVKIKVNKSKVIKIEQHDR